MRFLLLALIAHVAFAQVPSSHSAATATTAATAATHDSSYIAPDGTAHITRVIPIPNTVSPQAQKLLARQIPDTPLHTSLDAMRHHADLRRVHDGKIVLSRYPARVRSGSIAGVPVMIVTPTTPAAENTRNVLINLHGGGYEVDCCSLVESIPLANLTHSEVVAVLYRLAPEHPFPAAVDDAIAVYRELLKTHSPKQIVIYGTSAGAVMCGEVAMKIKALHLPEPAALGIFSGFGDFSKNGDSLSFFTVVGLGGYLTPPHGLSANRRAYAGNTPLNDPMLSPIYGDLHNLPPTLFLTSTRDWFLSGTTIEQRAFLRAGDETQLVVFEALPHAFWLHTELPESDEAFHIMANFFEKHLPGSAPGM